MSVIKRPSKREEHQAKLKHNRQMLTMLRDYKFKTDVPLPLPQPSRTTVHPTRDRDAAELGDLRMLCEENILTEEMFVRFQTYVDRPLEKDIHSVRQFYMENNIPNSHFRLARQNGQFKVSYRCGFFYSIDEFDASILSMDYEIGQLIKGFRKIKNTQDLNQCQLQNSAKMIHAKFVNYSSAVLHSII